MIDTIVLKHVPSTTRHRVPYGLSQPPQTGTSREVERIGRTADCVNRAKIRTKFSSIRRGNFITKALCGGAVRLRRVETE